jgi:hypothetical protein
VHVTTDKPDPTETGNSRSSRTAGVWGLEEPEYLIALVALLALLIGFVFAVAKGGDAKIFAAFTTVLGTIVGHALGGAGKRRSDERANRASTRVQTLVDTLQRVRQAPDIETARQVVSSNERMTGEGL